jgi:hypothetical protein
VGIAAVADRGWALSNQEWADGVLEIYFGYAPNFRHSIKGRHVISAPDLQCTCHITGGNISRASIAGFNHHFARRRAEGATHRRTAFANCYRERRKAEHLTRERAVFADGDLITSMMKTGIGQKVGYRVARSKKMRALTERLNKTR